MPRSKLLLEAVSFAVLTASLTPDLKVATPKIPPSTAATDVNAL